MEIFLKLFLGTGIPFGIIMMLFYEPISGLLSGLFFGGLMSVILGTIHIISVKRIQAKKEPKLKESQNE